MFCINCGKEYSSGSFCAFCGHQHGIVTQDTPKPKKTSNKRRKLPNGFGSIVKHSGNRRNPYAAYPPVTEFKPNGTKVLPKAIGYFPTYYKALDALTQFNRTPRNMQYDGITFKELVDEYETKKFASAKLSERSKIGYRTFKAKFSPLNQKEFRDLRTSDYQSVIDNWGLSKCSTSAYISYLKEVGRYALERDVVSKDYTQFVSNTAEKEKVKGEPFTAQEIDILWKNTSDKMVRTALVMIYSGMRISELITVKIDKENMIFVGGSKTEAGKGRTIPIHPKIVPFLDDYPFLKDNNDKHNYQYNFSKMLQNLGITSRRTPHSCRHTFSWLADSVKMDTISKKMIMGHALTGEVEISTYGHRTVEQLREEIVKIV